MNKNLNKKLGSISEGGGYSSDSQQVPAQNCYNATAQAGSGSNSVIKLSSSMSFSDLQNQLQIDVSTGGGYGMFSGSAEAKYMRSVEDKDYTLSLNYYEYMYDTVTVQLNGYGINALNPFGQQSYQNGKNPYFGIICGDNYINSYQQGAILVMSINIEFASHYEKDQFSAEAGSSFADIFNAAGSISDIAIKNNIKGFVTMQAYQAGGEPSQLSKILSKNSDGSFYILSCSLQNMQNCVNAANNLLNYASELFPSQISFLNNTGLTPLGQSFITMNPIKYLGLVTPPSLVNQTVLEDRILIANALKENQYYEQKFYELLNSYPVAWDTTGTFYQTAQNLYHQAQNNIEVVTSPSNPAQGGLGCFYYPDECISIYKNIQSQLVPITANDLTFLDQIQYSVPVAGGIFYNNGGDLSSSWTALPQGSEYITGVRSVYINDTYYMYNVDVNTPDSFNIYSEATKAPGGLTYNGADCDARNPHSGTGCNNPIWEHVWSQSYSMQEIPFYFGPYNSSVGAGTIGNIEDSSII